MCACNTHAHTCARHNAHNVYRVCLTRDTTQHNASCTLRCVRRIYRCKKINLSLFSGMKNRRGALPHQWRHKTNNNVKLSAKLCLGRGRINAESIGGGVCACALQRASHPVLSCAAFGGIPLLCKTVYISKEKFPPWIVDGHDQKPPESKSGFGHLCINSEK